VPSGDGFTDAQVREMSQALSSASRDTGLHFSVFVGPVDRPIRTYAERLHAALGDSAPAGVLICVSPGDREMEIVTGAESGRRLNDRNCALAAMSMASTFSGGDLVGGVVTGLRMMADIAGRVHVEQ